MPGQTIELLKVAYVTPEAGLPYFSVSFRNGEHREATSEGAADRVREALVHLAASAKINMQSRPQPLPAPPKPKPKRPLRMRG